MGKIQVQEHTQSYQAISTKSPHGLRCLKVLFSEYDSSQPSRLILNSLFAKDFQDNENGTDRSVGRDEAIDNIISSRARCTKHQMDLKHAWCVENSGSSHTVFFEGIRFMFLDGDSDWTRVPFSGRIEVRIKENRFTLKDAVVEVVTRRMTSDTGQLVSRDLQQQRPQRRTSSSSPISPIESPMGTLRRSTSKIAIPAVSELPAVTTSLMETKSLPSYQSSELLKGAAIGTPTVISGSSGDGELMLKQ
ncbi:uncharacterized protein Z518_03309 [Rhinocladiella mackenziei CBS 650.93]|uniref:Rhinocladiella mackenziei CBS 650.93 unplaced genomic scaffold supercont1.2, whole genome shotgun sequence n=1 Tax=Rhinocladiella mackenziei CBS 650.93 TaxID=1442369 RepID=A0A0D2G2A4_9EURO|nr:uncharacterized protein Z518_03309 [Rhinocladiella mackenziei CBS 650.93]KIX08652.1 hypothetical protein Z518_03309 [Rhinocladiella mackenziei CBS 650.93]